MNPSRLPFSSDRVIADQAAAWLARRDRGLNQSEQDAYMDWLREERHAAALAEQERTLRRMMQLGQWQPLQSDEPNPDLFAPRRRTRWPLLAAMGAAAVVTLAATALWRAREPAGSQVAVNNTSYLRVNERMALPDGSLVELRDGSHLQVAFTNGERRVRLTGEAHFTVAKNLQRPFVVESAGVHVRAVGTAFNVRQDANAVEVTVTEGRVRVAPPEGTGSISPEARDQVVAPLVAAGERAIVPLDGSSLAPHVTSAAPDAIAEILAWQMPRLQFFETPLRVAVAEMNRHNRVQIVLESAGLGEIPIGGTFRVNNVDGFVRLLETTLKVRVASPTEDWIVLSRSHN
jgi:transmembrane sensor